MPGRQRRRGLSPGRVACSHFGGWPLSAAGHQERPPGTPKGLSALLLCSPGHPAPHPERQTQKLGCVSPGRSLGGTGRARMASATPSSIGALAPRLLAQGSAQAPSATLATCLCLAHSPASSLESREALQCSGIRTSQTAKTGAKHPKGELCSGLGRPDRPAGPLPPMAREIQCKGHTTAHLLSPGRITLPLAIAPGQGHSSQS